MHALAQPTPPGDGPMGFFTVINDAIVTTEKVSLSLVVLEASVHSMQS